MPGNANMLVATIYGFTMTQRSRDGVNTVSPHVLADGPAHVVLSVMVSYANRVLVL
jgi:hypothetical protein